MKRACWLVIAVACGLVGGPCGGVRADDEPGKVREAEVIALETEALCKQLQFAFRCDREMSQADRIRCAEYLAELQHYPAIPAILRRITETRKVPSDDGYSYAYTKALAIYGEAALPEVLTMLEQNASPETPDDVRKSHYAALSEVIAHARMRTVLLRILRGRFAASLDRDQQSLLRTAIQRVTAIQEVDDTPPQNP